jgi:hypothetical protein
MSNPKEHAKSKPKSKREAEPQLDDFYSRLRRSLKLRTWPHEQSSDEYTIADMSDEDVDAFAHNISERLAKKK